MKKLILVLLVIFFFSALDGRAEAVSQNSDSSWSVWQNTGTIDTLRMRAISEVVEDIINKDADSAIALADLLISFAREKGNTKYEAKGFFYKGRGYNILGKFRLAIRSSDESIVHSEIIKDSLSIAKSLTIKGNSFYYQGMFPQALNNWNTALSYLIQQESPAIYSSIIGNIGNIYAIQGEHEIAIEKYKAFLITHRKLGIADTAIQLSNIGYAYSFLGDYEKSLEYSFKSLKLSKAKNNLSEISNTSINIAETFIKMNQIDSAKKYLERTLASDIDVKSKTQCLLLLGGISDAKGESKHGIKYCLEAFALTEQLNMLKEERDACECLYKGYKKVGEGTRALAYHERMLNLTDSLHIDEVSKKLQQIEFADQVLQDSIATAEKERLVEEAHQEEVRQKNQTRNGLITGSAFVLLLAGGLFSRNRYISKSKAVVEKEKDRSNNLLLNILPADIAEELKVYGKAEARDFNKVSILFTDFKGFTEQSAKMTASNLVGEINVCFEAFDGIMVKYGVEKIKTIGDAYMAAGGLPVPTDDSVKNTVLAALEMQAFIGARSEELGARGLPFFEMRVGIHTGPVVAGIVGVKKFQYDIWGDTVNTASRMESAGEVGKVNVSQATYELLKDDAAFVFESRGKIEAKGKGELEMWFVQLKTN